MEYQAIDSNGDRAAQYKDLAKLYEIEDVTLFSPMPLSATTCSRKDISVEEHKFFLSYSIKRTREGRWDNGWDIKWNVKRAEIPYEIHFIFFPARRTGRVTAPSELI